MTCQTEYKRLKRVLMKSPKHAFRNQDYINNHWKALHYTTRPDFTKALEEFDSLVGTLVDHGIQVDFLPDMEHTGLDSIYVRDASIITDEGAIICNMGKSLRSDEPHDQMENFESMGIEIVGVIEGDATLEGGDVAWVDEETLAVAHGYRTNARGIESLRALLNKNIELIVVPSPHYKGPSDVFHLMSVFSPIDKNLAVVYSPLMAVPFRQELIRRGYQFVEVPDEEFGSLGCNVLAIAPRTCMMTRGNPKTKADLKKAGVDVIEVDGWEICLKGSGGPTCLTRPLARY